MSDAVSHSIMANFKTHKNLVTVRHRSLIFHFLKPDVNSCNLHIFIFFKEIKLLRGFLGGGGGKKGSESQK